VRNKRYIDDPEHDIMGSYPHEISYVSPNSIDVDGIYLQVYRAGIVMQTPPDFLVSRDDSYMFSLMHCVFRGRGTVTVRGQTHEIKRGQIFVLASNEPHVYSTDSDDPLGMVWVEFGGGNSSQLVKHILNLGGPVYSGRVFTSVIDLCTSILYQPNQQSPRISAILYEMLMCLCSHVDSDIHQSPVDQSILKYIDENIGHRLSLTEISAAFGYHPAYFSSRFAKNMGVTFSKYVMQRKMIHACYLLEITDWPVDRIAHDLGFCDISHFIQRFKTSEGVTPSIYRRNHRKTTKENPAPEIE